MPDSPQPDEFALADADFEFEHGAAAPQPAGSPQAASRPDAAPQAEAPATGLRQTGTDAFENRALGEERPGLDKARGVVSGGIIAHAPAFFGLESGVGADRQRQLDMADRNRGLPLGERVRSGDATHTAVQFGANVAADVVGLVGAKAMMAMEAAVNVGRELGEGTAMLVAPAILKPETLRIMQQRAQRGDVSLEPEGYAQRLVARSAQGLKAFTEGLSPAVTAAALAPEGERSKEFWEAFYAYPVQSLIGPAVLGKELALKRGGIERMLPVKEGAPVRLENVRGEPVKLNDFGMKVYNRTPDWAKPILFDADSAEVISKDRAAVEARTAASKVKSKAAFDLGASMEAHKDEFGKAWDEIRQGVLDNGGLPLTNEQTFRIIEGSGHGKDFGGIRKMIRAPDIDPDFRNAAQRLGSKLEAAGMDPDRVRMALTHMSREAMDYLEKPPEDAVGQSGLVAEVLQGDKKTYAKPAEVLAEMDRHMTGLDEAGQKAVAMAVDAKAAVLEHDPAWIAAMDRRAEAAGPDGKYTFIPASESVLRDGYREAHGTLVDAERERAVALKAHADELRAAGKVAEADAFDKRAARAAKTRYDVHAFDHGVVEAEYPFKLWTKYAQRMGSGPDAARGKARLAGLFRADPLVRYLADRSAPEHVRWLARRLSDPTQPEYKFRQMLRETQAEIADNRGIDPVVMAKRFDEYLSHSFAEATHAEAMFHEEMNPPLLGLAQKFQGARNRRGRSTTEAASAFAKMLDDGKVDLPRVLQDTVNRVAMTAQNMKYWDALYEHLRSGGLAAEHEKPGWTQIATSAAVERGKNASRDPYNYLFGNFAGKWVDPQLARQLGLAREQFKGVVPILSTWKLLKTVFNLFGYQQRNHVSDLVQLASASKLSPLDAGWRRESAIAVDSVQRFYDDVQAGRAPRIDNTMVEAIRNGIFNPSSGTVLASEIGQGMQAASGKIADLLSRTHVTSEVKTLAAQQRIALFAKTLGVDIPKSLYGTATHGAWESMRKVGQEAKTAWQAEQTGVVSKAWLAGGKALRQFNAELSDSAISKWTAREENQRRLFAYRLARHELKLDEAGAVRFVQATVYGAKAMPEWLEKVRTSAAQFVMPPFLGYGEFQLRTGARRALNDPKMFAIASLAMGMDAYNEEAQAQDEPDQKAYLARLGQSLMSSTGANRLMLGEAKDLSNAFADLGMQKLADAIAPAIYTDEDGRKTLARLALTLPLRDIANLQNLLYDNTDDAEAATALARSNPFVDAGMTAIDPTARSLAGKGFFSGKRAIDDATLNPGARTMMVLDHALRIMLPERAFDQIAQVYKAGKAVATGKPQVRGKTGDIVSPVEVSRIFSPAAPISPVDIVAMTVRLSNTLKAKVSEGNKRTAAYISDVNPREPEGRADIRKAKIERAFETKRIYLRFVRALGHPVADADFERLYAREKEVLAGQSATPTAQLQDQHSDGMVDAFAAAVEDTWNGAQQEGE